MIDEIEKKERVMVDEIESKTKSREEASIAREEAMVDEMKEESKSRGEEAMMKEIEKERNLVNEIKEESKSREEASAAREEAMMNKIERMSNTEEALFRELKETREKSQSDIKVLHFELATVTLACLGISLVAFLSLRRGG